MKLLLVPMPLQMPLISPKTTPVSLDSIEIIVTSHEALPERTVGEELEAISLLKEQIEVPL